MASGPCVARAEPMRMPAPTWHGPQLPVLRKRAGQGPLAPLNRIPTEDDLPPQTCNRRSSSVGMRWVDGSEGGEGIGV